MAPKWLAVQKDDCFTVHLANDQETAENAADNFAVTYNGDAESFLRREGKTVVNHSEGDVKDNRKVVYRPGFPQTYGGGCVSTLCCGLFIIIAFAFVFTYFVP